MTMKDLVPRRDHAAGERLVEEYERSGLPCKVFCARRSVSVNTLNYWRTKLRREAAGRSGFVELTAVAAAGAGEQWDVELELGGGVVLRVRRGG